MDAANVSGSAGADSSPAKLILETSPPPGGDGPLFAAPPRIYPQSVKGFFRRVKWAILIATLGVYYALPFIRWDRGASAPHQAVLFDLDHQRFYFFSIEIWPQEVYYITGLLILAALVLFLLNALAGRVWCGYLCPQTVWTDLFMLVERWAEGDRRERMRKDAGPWTARLLGEKALKHALWLMIACWTGGALVLYFTDAPKLMGEILTFQAPGLAYFWIGVFTATTYLLAGFMREQVCLYMCPWPRIQAALTDENALNVTYRLDRGEPRMSVKKADALRKAQQKAGDCVDCNQCVAVCPTGVDIRNGLDMGCIQCGLCIDACDNVMRKIGRPERLIGYDTDVNIRRRLEGKGPLFRPVRVRTTLYAVLIVLIAGAMVGKLATRADAGIAVIHDRNPLFTTLSDGSIRNGYKIRFSNMAPQKRKFILDVQGLSDLHFDIVGAARDAQGREVVELGPDQTQEARLLVSQAGRNLANSTPLTFSLADEQGAIVATAQDFFRAP